MKKILTEAAKNLLDAKSTDLALFKYNSIGADERSELTFSLYKINDISEIDISYNGTPYLNDIDVYATITLIDAKTPSWNAREVYCVSAEKGWGPLMYDIAMSEVGPLMAYRSGDISKYAQKVWFNYMYKRPDVKRLYLDDIKHPRTKRIIDDSDVYRPKTKINPFNYVYYLDHKLDLQELYRNNESYVKQLINSIEEDPSDYTEDYSEKRKLIESEIYKFVEEHFNLCYAAIPKEHKKIPTNKGWIQKYLKQDELKKSQEQKDLLKTLAGIDKV